MDTRHFICNAYIFHKNTINLVSFLFKGMLKLGFDSILEGRQTKSYLYYSPSNLN